MNPYDPPQTATPATTIVLQEGLSEQQQQVFLGYRTCSTAGKYLSWGMLASFTWYGAVFISQATLKYIDVRVLYVFGLIPLYYLLVGWILQRQGLGTLAMHSGEQTLRTRFRICRLLSLLKLLTVITSLVLSEDVSRVFSLAVLGLWPGWELATILLQFSAVRELGQQVPTALKGAREFYLVLGIGVVCLALTGVLLQIAGELAWQPYHAEDVLLVARYFTGIALFLYALELKAYAGFNLLCAQSFEQVAS